MLACSEFIVEWGSKREDKFCLLILPLSIHNYCQECIAPKGESCESMQVTNSWQALALIYIIYISTNLRILVLIHFKMIHLSVTSPFFWIHTILGDRVWRILSFKSWTTPWPLSDAHPHDLKEKEVKSSTLVSNSFSSLVVHLEIEHTSKLEFYIFLNIYSGW